MQIECQNPTELTQTKCTSAVDAGYFWKKKTVISFILSILVVCIHCTAFDTYSPNFVEGTYPFISFFDSLIRDVLCQIAVPLFFILSGALFFRNYHSSSYSSKIKSRVKTLVIPYLIWNSLGMFFCIFTSYTFISNYFVGREIFEITPSNVLLSIFHYQCNSPFWYVFALLCYVAISPLIDVLICKKPVGIITIFISIVLLFFDVQLPSSFIYNPNSIVFYLIGCYMGKHHFSFFAKKAQKGTSYLSLVVFIASVTYFFLPSGSLNLNPYALNTIMLVVASLSFWFAFDLVSDVISAKDYHSYSFMIYAIHPNIVAVLVKLIYLFFPKTQLMYFVNAVLSVSITVLLSVFLIKYLKIFFPRIYALVSGER